MGTGSFLPEKNVSNTDLEKYVDKNRGTLNDCRNGSRGCKESLGDGRKRSN